MFDEADRSWAERSKRPNHTRIEISFLLARAFHPDEEDVSDTSAIPLPDPGGATSTPWHWRTASRDADAHKQSLLTYYQKVLELAEQYQHPYESFCHYFWLDLTIGDHRLSPGLAPTPPSGTINFIYQNFDEIDRFCRWLEGAQEGDQWFDVDQGWEVQALRLNSKFHIRLGGFDQGGEYENLAFDRNSLLALWTPLRHRVYSIISYLSKKIGNDYWTAYRYDLISEFQ